MSDDLRVALLGYGLAGRVFHAPLITATPGLRLAAVVTADPGRVAEVRADHPDVAVLADAASVWDGADAYDIAVVATANAAHVPQTRAALGAGLHVVVDKPMAADAATAQDLVDAAGTAGRMLTVFQNRRWDSDLLTVRRLMAAGTFGEVHRLESRFERWRPEPKGGWRETGGPEDMPGLLYDLGAHLVDQALLLLGPVVSVTASARAVRQPGGADDDTQLLLRHASGAVSLLFASAVAALPEPRLRVLGTRAGYEVAGLDSQEDALRDGRSPAFPGWGEEPTDAWGRLVTADGETRPVRSEPGDWPAFYAGVVAAVRDGAPPPVDPRDVVADLRVLDAARESARTGATVVLDPPAAHVAATTA
ncbi:MAG: Gfo/Idh/MocA family oxidoreductase [Candidatus Nanopelagicales bacterium]